jgi:mRNA-degrading endonuclease toxin of MazEF toxin-antitoxin module
MQPSDIYLASFPFGDVPGMTLRPVLLLTPPTGPMPEVLVAYISSVIPPVLLPSDIVLDPHTPEGQPTCLKAVSVLRLHKLATIHTASLRRYLGRLTLVTEQAVRVRLRALLQL